MSQVRLSDLSPIVILRTATKRNYTFWEPLSVPGRPRVAPRALAAVNFHVTA